MRAVDIVIKKRDGLELTQDEIRFLIDGFTGGDIPDYQVAAWCMAVLFRGMTPRETAELTQVMVDSGERIDLSSVVPIAVDKHSTGGVGDKTSLVVLPTVAANGLAVGKMSGRALGFSGGTLDKMESIRGFRADLTREEFLAQLKKVGIVLSGQTAKLTPADGKLYALRDVTGTVPSIPLIASSIMSKKIAGGAQGIVLDVKVGKGAFMETMERAVELADLMVEIGRHADRRTVALISDMNQPLGDAVGNALEVKEAIASLRGEGPQDFHAHCIEVAGYMLILGECAQDIEAARALAASAIDSGASYEKFLDLVRAQGGDTDMVEHPERLPQAAIVEEVPAPVSGTVTEIDAREVAFTAVDLGAGREKKGDPIDHAVGVVVHTNIGDRIEAGVPLFTVHANDERLVEPAVQRLLEAHRIEDKHVEPLPLFYRTIGI
jgi:pyrimidine-nucleoside phosphorylase